MPMVAAPPKELELRLLEMEEPLRAVKTVALRVMVQLNPQLKTLSRLPVLLQMKMISTSLKTQRTARAFTFAFQDQTETILLCLFLASFPLQHLTLMNKSMYT